MSSIDSPVQGTGCHAATDDARDDAANDDETDDSSNHNGDPEMYREGTIQMLAAVVNLGQQPQPAKCCFFCFYFDYFKRNKHKSLYSVQHGKRNLVNHV